MATFAGLAIFVSALIFHICMGYGPDAGLWDSEPLQCVNKVSLYRVMNVNYILYKICTKNRTKYIQKYGSTY